MNLFHFIFRRVYIRFDYLCLIFETLNIKITTLMLQKTFLARCDNRACLAKTNGNYTLFTLIFKNFTKMIISFKLFVIFAPNIRIRLDISNRCSDI